MSFSTPSGTNNPTLLNQAAAHETALYDPNVHDNQIVAIYETDAQAHSAQQAVVASGVPASAIQVVSRGTETGTLGGVNAEDNNSGVWGAIKSMFVPDDDRSGYTHAIGRGHAMLVVTPTAGMDRQKIIHTLEGTNPVDFDARLEEWRQAGYDTTNVHQDFATNTGAMGAAAMATGSETGAARAPASTAPVAGNDTIKVMQESIRVGKREVAAGAVRIRSYVVERPIEEQVRLREERVTVERTPVDRPATGAEFGAFQERTIEARATSEEAVVSKEARVVEEIGLRKDTTERTETVRDTVRKTEVEIDGQPTTTTGSGTAGTTTPVATPGATTSGANSPRK